jgi:hypothetical protein
MPEAWSQGLSSAILLQRLQGRDSLVSSELLVAAQYLVLLGFYLGHSNLCLHLHVTIFSPCVPVLTLLRTLVILGQGHALLHMPSS